MCLLDKYRVIIVQKKCDNDISTIFWKTHDISRTIYRQTICRGLLWSSTATDNSLLTVYISLQCDLLHNYNYWHEGLCKETCGGFWQRLWSLINNIVNFDEIVVRFWQSSPCSFFIKVQSTFKYVCKMCSLLPHFPKHF